jgi:cell division protein FtsB
MRINLLRAAKKIKENWLAITVIIILLLTLKSCNNENKTLADANQSGKDISEYYIKQYNTTKDERDSLKAENQDLAHTAYILEIEATEVKKALKKAQAKTVKPIYIKELQPCNDSLQNMYTQTKTNDSLCNSAISVLNSVNKAKDSIIANNQKILEKSENETYLLFDATQELKKEKAKVVEYLAVSEKQTKKESNKKTFWQIVTTVMAIFSFRK